LPRNPIAFAVAGALTIAFSAILVRLAKVAPETSAFFRCAYAVPPLLVIAWFERRRLGPLPLRSLLMSWGAGVLFALDLLFWHHAIGYVGAGLATVLGNLQIFLVALGGWLIFRERPSTNLMLAAPVVFGGVVLIAGLFESDPFGADPGLGVAFGLATSVAYAGYMLVTKASAGAPARNAGLLAQSTTVAALTIALLSPFFGGADFTPAWPAHGWLLLLALGPQVIGWLLITYSLPRQPAALTALLLLIQPMATVAISTLALGERPSALQITGCAVILAGVLYGSRGPQREQEAQVPKTSTV